jgi:hypothetical protein
MKKYNIEGDIDFFSELYKSLDNEENNCKTDEDNNLCLITNQALIDKFVKMECGHKFNYLPLFNDLVNHKKKFNNMEGTSTHLKMNEIRCPYCRKKSRGLLPYYEELGLSKVAGVNYIDINYNLANEINSMYPKCYGPCEFLTPNVYFNPNSQNITEFYKSNLNIEDCKFIKCKHTVGTQINNNYNNFDIGIDDEKYYCWNHKKIVINKYKKDKSDKAKEEAKLLKEKAKLLKKETKEKEKEETQKIKEELKKTIKAAKMNKNIKTINNNEVNDNVVIGMTNIITNDATVLCIEIIKSGPKKGLQCCLKIYENNLCKRHYNLNNKNNDNI